MVFTWIFIYEKKYYWHLLFSWMIHSLQRPFNIFYQRWSEKWFCPLLLSQLSFERIGPYTEVKKNGKVKIVTWVICFQSDNNVAISRYGYRVLLGWVVQIQSWNIAKFPILIAPWSIIAAFCAALNVSVSVKDFPGRGVVYGITRLKDVEVMTMHMNWVRHSEWCVICLFKKWVYH